MSEAPPDPHSNNDLNEIQLEEQRRELDNIQSNFPLVICPYEDEEYIKDLNVHLGKEDKEDFKRILHAHLLSNGAKCDGWTVDDLKSVMKESYGYLDNKQVDKFVKDQFGFASLKLFLDKASDIARVDEHGFIHPELNDENRELYEDAMASARNKDDKEKKKDDAVSRRLEDPEKIRGYYLGVNQLQKAIQQALDKHSDKEGALADIKAEDGSDEEVVGVLYSHMQTEFKELYGVDLSKECKSICGRSSVMKALKQGQLKCLMDTVIMQEFSPAQALERGCKAGTFIGLRSGQREYSEVEIQAAVEECRQQHGDIAQKQNARYERWNAQPAEPRRYNNPADMRRKLDEQTAARNASSAAPAAAPSTAPAPATAPASTSAQPMQQRAPISDSENSEDEEQVNYSDVDEEEKKERAKKKKESDEKKKEKRERKERERSISSASVSEPQLVAPPTTNPSPPTPTAAAAPAESRAPTPPEVPYPEEAMQAAHANLSTGRHPPPGANQHTNPWEEHAPAQPMTSTPSPPVPVYTPPPILSTEYNPSAAAAAPTPQPALQQYGRDEMMSLAQPQPTPQQGDPLLMQGAQYPPQQQYEQSFMQQQQQPQMQQQPFPPQQQLHYDQQYAPQGQYMPQPAPAPVVGQTRIQGADGNWYWGIPAPPPAAAPATPAAPATTTPPPQQTVSPVINFHLNNNCGQPGGGTTTYTVHPNQQGQPMITTATQGDLTQQTLLPTLPPTPSPYAAPQVQGGYQNPYPPAPPSTYGHGGYLPPPQQQQHQYPPNQNWQDPAGYGPPGQPGYHNQYQLQGGMVPPPAAPPSTIHPLEPQHRQSAFPPRAEYAHPQPPHHHHHHQQQQQLRREYDHPAQSHYADPQLHLAQQQQRPPRRQSPPRHAPVYRDQLNDRDSGIERDDNEERRRDEERRRRVQALGGEVGNARRRPAMRADDAFIVPPPHQRRHENRDDDFNYSDEFRVERPDERPRYDQLGNGPRPPLGPPQGSSTPLNQSLNMWAMFNDLTTPRRRVRWMVISTLKNIRDANSERQALGDDDDGVDYEIVEYDTLLSVVSALTGNEMEMYTALEDMTISFMRFLVDMEVDGLVHLYIGSKPIRGTNCVKQVMYVSDPFSEPPAHLGLTRAETYIH